MHEHNTAFHLSFAPVTPLPGIHPRDTQAKTWKAVCIVIHRGTFYNSKKLKITQMSLIGNWWLKFGTSTWGLFSCEKKWELSLHTATEWTPGYNVSEKSKPERAHAGGSQNAMVEWVTDTSVPKRSARKRSLTEQFWTLTGQPPLGSRPGINLGDPQFCLLGPWHYPFFLTISYL